MTDPYKVELIVKLSKTALAVVEQHRAGDDSTYLPPELLRFANEGDLAVLDPQPDDDTWVYARAWSDIGPECHAWFGGDRHLFENTHGNMNAWYFTLDTLFNVYADPDKHDGIAVRPVAAFWADTGEQVGLGKSVSNNKPDDARPHWPTSPEGAQWWTTKN